MTDTPDPCAERLAAVEDAVSELRDKVDAQGREVAGMRGELRQLLDALGASGRRAERCMQLAGEAATHLVTALEPARLRWYALIVLVATGGYRSPELLRELGGMMGLPVASAAVASTNAPPAATGFAP